MWLSFDIISISTGFNLCFIPDLYALLPAFLFLLLSLHKSQTTKMSCTAVVYTLLFSKRILVLFHYFLATLALLLLYLESKYVVFIFLGVADHLRIFTIFSTIFSYRRYFIRISTIFSPGS